LPAVIITWGCLDLSHRFHLAKSRENGGVHRSILEQVHDLGTNANEHRPPPLDAPHIQVQRFRQVRDELLEKVPGAGRSMMFADRLSDSLVSGSVVKHLTRRSSAFTIHPALYVFETRCSTGSLCLAFRRT